MRKTIRPNGGSPAGTEPAPTVWLADPHPLMRAGLRSQLEGNGFHVAAEGACIEDLARHAAEVDHPHLVILDREAGGEALARFRTLCPKAAIILLGGDAELAALTRAFAAGADGYLLKNITPPALIASCRLALLGEKVFPRIVTQFLGSAHAGVPQADAHPTCIGDIELSDRELCIIRGLAAGQTNKCIANHLAITEATVKVNLKAILRKLGVSNRTQVAIWALQNNLKPLDSRPFARASATDFDTKASLQ